MNVPSPFPLFGTYKLVKGLNSLQPYADEIPFVKTQIDALDEKIPGVEFEYGMTIEFINRYGRKSTATFNNFRSEAENFLLYAWLIKEKPIKDMSFDDINDYIDFYMKPSVKWINTSQTPHFIKPGSKRSEADQYLEGELVHNRTWRPFRVKDEDFKTRAKSIKRNVSQSSIKSMFSILSLFYVFLTLKNYLIGDPIPAIKKFSPYIVKTSEPPIIRTFSKEDWELIKEILTYEADQNPEYERNLFTIITLKSLYLRISEVSVRENWTPVMGDIVRGVHLENSEKGMFLNLLGKGNVLRRASIPQKYADIYLKRYRNHLGLSDFPSEGEKTPLVPSIGGKKGISDRQASRIVKEGFGLVIENLLARDNYQGNLDSFMSATTHWLRHTGASHDVETRPLKHIADDLGHRDMATTDRNYVQVSYSERMKSGLKRDV